MIKVKNPNGYTPKNHKKKNGKFVPLPLADRFWPNVSIQGNGCWNWIGHDNNVGYGLISYNGKQIPAHRASLIIHGIKLPPADSTHECDHLCRNRACVNPEHIEIVTRGENMRRGEIYKKREEYLKNKTHCRNGHELKGDNLRIDHGVHRVCRECNRVNARNCYHRTKARNGIKSVRVIR
jgi:hypothetical protein